VLDCYGNQHRFFRVQHQRESLVRVAPRLIEPAERQPVGAQVEQHRRQVALVAKLAKHRLRFASARKRLPIVTVSEENFRSIHLQARQP
jgi:hypothetical protein